MNFMLSEGVDMQSLNPMNFALKNDYIDNLLTIGMIISTNVNRPITIVEGFVSRSKLTEDCRKGLDLNHATGNAISFTWDDFNEQNALGLGHRLLDLYQCSVVINMDKGVVSLYYSTKKRKFIYSNKNIYKILRIS